MEKYEAQRYKGPVEGNFEDATTAAILGSLECCGDQESNGDDLRDRFFKFLF